MLALSACEERRQFDSDAWKSEAQLENPRSPSLRPAMLADFKRRFPAGSNKEDVVTALGPSETEFSDICAEEARADSCFFYNAGASYVDPNVIVVSFEKDQLLSVRERLL
jgi:hypothetical protein